MQLLVVRHARAKDRQQFASSGMPDSERPLTAKGIRRMKKGARGLRSLVPCIDLLVTSPLRRAIETGQIISDVYGGIRFIERSELAPAAAPQKLIDWLNDQPERRITCVVGHEPDLSELLTLVLAQESKRPAKLKKGSATLVKFDAAIKAASGRLQWYRPVRELASLI
jgi:phosphohistidine phosphatase